MCYVVVWDAALKRADGSEVYCHNKAQNSTTQSAPIHFPDSPQFQLHVGIIAGVLSTSFTIKDIVDNYNIPVIPANNTVV
jgi:hypothetical protein